MGGRSSTHAVLLKEQEYMARTRMYVKEDLGEHNLSPAIAYVTKLFKDAGFTRQQILDSTTKVITLLILEIGSEFLRQSFDESVVSANVLGILEVLFGQTGCCRGKSGTIEIPVTALPKV